MADHIHRPSPSEAMEGLSKVVDTSVDTALVSGYTILYIFELFATGALLFLLVYFIITLSDLECDYLNAQQCCYRLNMWVLPKLCLHCVAAILLLLSGHFALSGLNIPLTFVWGREYWWVPAGNFGVYDPVEIHRMGQLKRHMRDVFVGVMFYLVMFFIYLYCFLTHLVTNNPMPKANYDDDYGL